jgi:hypothetical protein
VANIQPQHRGCQVNRCLFPNSFIIPTPPPQIVAF